MVRDGWESKNDLYEQLLLDWTSICIPHGYTFTKYFLNCSGLVVCRHVTNFGFLSNTKSISQYVQPSYTFPLYQLIFAIIFYPSLIIVSLENYFNNSPIIWHMQTANHDRFTLNQYTNLLTYSLHEDENWRQRQMYIILHKSTCSLYF